MSPSCSLVNFGSESVAEASDNPGDSAADDGYSARAYSCLGERRGVIRVAAGLFSMLRGFFFSVELGIQVRINVEPRVC